METIEPIEAIVPRRAQPYGEFIRRVALLSRAGLPVPSGYAIARNVGDALYAERLSDDERTAALLEPRASFPSDETLLQLRQKVVSQPLPVPLVRQLSEVFGTLRSLGAQTLTVSAFLVCDKITLERPLGEVWLRVDSEARLRACVLDAYGLLYDRTLLRALRASDVRNAGVAVLVQRMLDSMVSGVVYTRHPITADAGEWLIRTGYGLASGVRNGRVPSDVIRVSRDGFVRDYVTAAKHQMLRASELGERELVSVSEPLVARPSLTEAGLQEVLRLSARTERQVGRPVRIDWSVSGGRVHLLRVEPLPGEAKLPRTRSQDALVRERALWSHSELGEALPLPPSPLGWSLLQKLSRGGLASALSAAGAVLGAAPELIMDVRGAPYLNLGVLTEAVCRLPGMSPALLARVGLDLSTTPRGAARFDPRELRERVRSGPVDMTRSALRMYDSHFRFGERLAKLSSRMADDRGHFAGLDARLLSPDAVERVLCDVEAFMADVSGALMRVYGNWLATLLAVRTIFGHYLEQDALRLEKDLIWGRAELPSVETGYDFLRVGRTLSRDSRALAWADEDKAPPPAFVEEALDDFAARHRHEGMFLLDPHSPRWRETPLRLQGVMRALLADPMALAFAAERRELGKGRRERAEREWKRKVPMVLVAGAATAAEAPAQPHHRARQAAARHGPRHQRDP